MKKLMFFILLSCLETEPEANSELTKAIEQYHKYTCIRFVKRTSESGYINFYRGGGYVKIY